MAPAPDQLELYGSAPSCDMGHARAAVAFLTDEWGDGAEPCRSHLKTYQVKMLAIGLTLSAFLRGAA